MLTETERPAPSSSEQLVLTRNEKRVLAGVVVTALALFVAATIIIPVLPASADWVATLFDAYEAILVGFVVGVFGVLVPSFYGQARDRFERRKEVRRAFSQVETGIDYLPGIIASIDKLEAGYAKLEELQVMKHVALAYEPQLEELLEDKPDKSTETWAQKNYLILVAAECELQVHADDWDGKPRKKRIELLQNAHIAGRELYDVSTMTDFDACKEELAKIADCESNDTEIEQLRKKWKSTKPRTQNRVDVVRDLYRLFRHQRAREEQRSAARDKAGD